MFKFNFNGDEEKILKSEGTTNIKWYESKEIFLPNDAKDFKLKISKMESKKIDYGNMLEFTCVSPSEVINNLKQLEKKDLWDAVVADEQRSDLLPGKYEGGLKTWECTRDLAVYFDFNVIKKIETGLNGKYILDLGCGSGILGILCLKNNAHVTFQDYNQEVLEMMTIPNVFLNCDNFEERINFFSGDWSSFVQLFTKKFSNGFKFDYILTSETIYNPDNYEKLIKVFKTLLKPDGLIYIGAKFQYFGVGGSLFEFIDKLNANGFDHRIVMETLEGLSRQIVEVTFHKGDNGGSSSFENIDRTEE